jgi:hypothetical protein
MFVLVVGEIDGHDGDCGGAAAEDFAGGAVAFDGGLDGAGGARAGGVTDEVRLAGGEGQKGEEQEEGFHGGSFRVRGGGIVGWRGW